MMERMICIPPLIESIASTHAPTVRSHHLHVEIQIENDLTGEYAVTRCNVTTDILRNSASR